ncbi:hypothetical protein K7X08_014841 [Anisodus acutangulus]|uniref:Uncharacterized protein n=1 Tax=Anisodus acutangulus TaxID=402998 RepID=A0A9Q1R4R3_9SOLA|nr:hypothetical protein K7X08_014841 [Anisodus acutangulus]
MVGDFQRPANLTPLEPPTTDLLERIIHLPDSQASLATKTFDMWNITVKTSRRNLDFNMIKMRANVIRYLLPTDFVVINFSLIYYDIFSRVGDMGCELAWRIKAITYIECSSTNNESLANLLSEIEVVVS